MYRNITVNGFDLEVAKVRFGTDGFVVSGLTEDGYAVEQEFNFEDGVEISWAGKMIADVEEEVAPAKKERKPRKPKVQVEVVEVAQAVEVATDEEYAQYLTQRAAGKRGRAPKAIAAYIAAHNL